MDVKGVHFGRYMLQRLLARGGMGEVYLASLIGVAGFEKRCVIKKIRADLASDESFVERFLNEGRTLVALTHSNIVQIFDMGEVDGEYYLAMEYVKGGDLRCLLKRIPGHRVPLNIAVGVAMETLKGLSYAHRATDENGRHLGIVHRDVSSSNILISTQGEVKIIDFGIAKARTIESVSGIVQGKFAYMSPEQARGESLDKRTDLFSLGVVLYEMLCGFRPFDGSSDLQALERIKTGDYQRVSQINSEVDEEFESILARALERDREKRYPTADTFYDALVEYGRSHHLTSGQREIMSYFKPFIVDNVPVGSAEMLMDAALDRMLNAQAMVDGSGQTCTLMPTPTGNSSISSVTGPTGSMPSITGNSHISSITGNSHISSITGNSHISSISGQSGVSHISVITGQTGRRTLMGDSPEDLAQLEAMVAGGMPAEVGIESPEVRRNLKIRRFRLRIRYALIGAGIALLLVIIYQLFFYHVDVFRKFREWRSPQQVQNDVPPENSQNDVNDGASEVAGEMTTQRLILDMYHFFQKGFPLFLRTDPDNATMYIIEGSYRGLEENEKKVVLLPGNNAEIAVQAPGYETCLLHMYFDKDSQNAMQNTEWQNCRGVSSRFLAKEQRVEISVVLQPMRPVWTDPQPKPQDPEPLAANAVNGEDSGNETDSAENAFGAVDATATEHADARHNTSRTSDHASDRTVRTPKKTGKSGEKLQSSQGASSSAVRVSHAFKSNVSAEVVVNGEHHALPYTIEAESDAPVQIVPAVSGRKIAIPWQTKLSDKLPANVEFCEATIRIREYYVDGDPAPYQISDISVDGVLRARQTDMAIFVLPCGKHSFTASAKAHSVPLSASVQANLESGKPYTTAISLSQ